jgi:hypothetical protein
MYSKTQLDQSIKITLNAADPDGLVTADTYPAGNIALDGALTSNGRYANTTPQFLLITAVADESGNTFTFTGKDLSGLTYTYSVLGPNATTLVIPVPFSSIESNGISISDDASGDISIGITTQTATPWCQIDCWRDFFAPGLGAYVETSSTLNYTIQYTFQNAKSELPTRIYNDPNVASETTTQSTAIPQAYKFARLIINSYTNGAVWFEIAQPGAMHSNLPAKGKLT